MKRVLIQDNFASIEHTNSLRDLLKGDLNNNEIDIDFAFCLSQTVHSIPDYNLIISHPHLEGDCCLPMIRVALRNNVMVTLLYKTYLPHGKAIEAVAQSLNLDVLCGTTGKRETYLGAIEKYLLRK